MGSLLGAKGSSVTILNGITINQSQYGNPVPLLYGTTRVTGNLGWYGNFSASKVTQGGKGALGGGGQSSLNYAAALLLFLCEGPITSVNLVFADKSQYSTTSPDFTFTLFDGTGGQTPWSYLTTNFPSQAVPYDHTAYLANATFQLGSSAAMPNFSFEATGLLPFQYSGGAQIISLSIHIPSSGPYTITVVPPNGGTWNATLSVNNSSGQPFTDVSTSDGSTPTVLGGQFYAVNGTYTFNSANAGNPIFINYQYLPAGSVQDAEPSAILIDYLTSPDHGAGFVNPVTGASLLDPNINLVDSNSYKDYCCSMGFFLSPYENYQRSATDFLTEILEITNSIAVWSGQNFLKIIPYAEQAVSGNGSVYNPDTQPEYDFTDDDYIVDGKDAMPVQLNRKATADIFNTVNVEFLNRNYQYNTDIAKGFDQADIDRNGVRVMANLTYHSIQAAQVARLVAQLRLQRQLFTINSYTFKVRQDYCLLECMDYLTLTDKVLGLNNQLCRITEIDDDENDEITITAEEVPIGVAQAPIYNWQDSQGYAANYNVSPGSVAAPVIFSAPPLLVDSANGGYELWIAVSGTNPLWGGCHVHLSMDGTTYTQVGTIPLGARYGTLQSSLPTWTSLTLDNTDTLVATMLDAEMQIAAASTSDADNMRTLLYVGNAAASDAEIMSYAHSTLSGVNQYSLTYLWRGQYGSNATVHAAGENFVRLDDKIFKVPFDVGQLGQTMHLKFTSFNIYGGAEEALSGVTDYTKVLAAALNVPLVGTAGLAPNAASQTVTVTDGAIVATCTTASPTTNTGASVTVVTQGGEVGIDLSTMIRVEAGSGSVTDVQVQIRRDGSPLPSGSGIYEDTSGTQYPDFRQFGMLAFDIPPAGSHTYSVFVSVSGSTGSLVHAQIVLGNFAGAAPVVMKVREYKR